MSYNPETVKLDGKLLSFTGFKDRRPIKICLKDGDKVEFTVSGWGDDPYGQFYICQGVVSIDPDNLHFIRVHHDGVESQISLSDIQEKLDGGAVLVSRRLTAWY